jgi:ribosome-associated protein
LAKKTKAAAKPSLKRPGPRGARDGTQRDGKTGKTFAKTSGKTSAKSATAKTSTTKIPVRGSRSAGKAAGARAKSSGPAPERAAARAVSDPRQLDQARALALEAIEAALDKKALMPVLIDVSAMASYTDFIGIVSGRSDRQVDAIAENISTFMKSRGRRIIGQEGTGSGRWTLLDFGEIVIHVFYHPVREFYDLESLWIDAPRVKMEIPPDAILQQPDVLYGTL